jgi:predicted TIM-barrel fold metal-dependent hydrolase
MNRRDALAVIAGVAGRVPAFGAVPGAGQRATTPTSPASFIPDIPGPDPAPRVPRFTAPRLACDTHCHVYGPVDRYPYAPTRPYTPPEAPFAALRALHARIGVERGVIVNATPYGRNNRVVIDAIAESEGRYLGIGNVDDTMTDGELEALARGGLAGCRFTFISRLGGRPDMTTFDRIVRRIAPLGWHVDLYVDATSLDELAPRLERLPVPYVIDHMDASAGLGQPAFQRLLSLLGRDEKCWMKITGPERISRTGPPFHDAVPFAARLIETAPDRVLWGTDWPHPNVPAMPNDGDLMDLVPLYASDEAVRRKLLVDNPARLFKFRA